MALSRTLWTMRSATGKEITAAIFDVVTMRELRVSLGDALLESRLSRAGDAAALSQFAPEPPVTGGKIAPAFPVQFINAPKGDGITATPAGLRKSWPAAPWRAS